MRTYNQVMESVKEIVGAQTDDQLAQVLDLSRSAYSERKRRGSIPFEKIADICEKHGVSLEKVLYGKMIEPGLEGAEMYMPLATMNLPPEMQKAGCLFTVAIHRGLMKRSGDPCDVVLIRQDCDSMEPIIHVGDMCVADRKKNKVTVSGFYAVRLKEFLLAVRLQPSFDDGKVEVIFDNPAYKPFKVDEEKLEVIGRIIWVLKRVIRNGDI